ncbi:hypothetical protein GPALN_010159 [Globodera pallida]|nr:hypothetical protein GPALN_010159 [Globodera pallida]
MKLFLCILTILFQHFITSLGGVTKNTKEPEKLYQLMCQQDLTEAIEYRKTEFWQKLAKIDYTKVPEKMLSKFMEWQIRYASIERLFKYCEYLEECQNKGYAQDFGDENKSLKHIALKPTFTSTNDGILPIKEAMENIVLAFQMIFMNKTKKCFKICMDKKKLVTMRFENQEECVKVLAWTHHLASSQHIEDALSNLRNVKTHLLSAAVNAKVVKLVVGMPPLLIAEHLEKPSKKVHKIRSSATRNSSTSRNYDVIDQKPVNDFFKGLQMQLMIAELSNIGSGSSAACDAMPSGSGSANQNCDFFSCGNFLDACFTGCGACCEGCGACCEGCGNCDGGGCDGGGCDC